MPACRKAPLICIIDDDITTRRMLQGILQGAGFLTIMAGDVASAISLIPSEKPDLVLLDVNLPDGDGFAVCRKLQQESATSRIPVLFISAIEDLTTKVRGFECGGVDYITKPLAGEEVLARVTTHLRLKQAFDQLAELQAERIQRLALAQEALMPRPEDFPDAHFQMSLRQVLQAGGDFYDVIAVGPHIIDYIVADASGHDLAASFWTASLKTLLSEYATPINTPRQILRLVNNALMRILPSGVFFTAIYARLNRKRGRVWLVNAGHPPACIMPANGQAGRFISQEGDIIGVFPDADFNETEVAVQPHDRIFLYSDGLIEINGLQSAELSPLLRVCHAHGPAPLEQAVPSIVREITAGLVVHDDIVLMGVEV